MGQALNQFRTSLQMVQALLDLESGYSDPPGAAEAPAVTGLRGGVAVLVVAAFEQYLKDVVLERLSPLSTDPPPVTADDLPQELMVNSGWLSLDHAIRGKRFDQQATKVARWPQIKAAAQRVAHGLIDPEAFAQTGGNPNATKVKELFKQIGVADVFTAARPSFDAEWGKPESVTFLADKLEEIVNRRHIVAHTASALSVSRSDLTGAPPFLAALATALDSTLMDRVAELTSFPYPRVT